MTTNDSGVRIPVQPNGNAFLQGNYTPATETDELALKVVSGELPKGFRGTLYRVGPNPAYRPPDMQLYHWFDGDGLVHRFAFTDDGATYLSRFASTTRHQIEQSFGRNEFGGLRDFSAESKIPGLRALGYSYLDLMDIWFRIKLGVTLTDDQIHRAFSGTYGANTNLLAWNDRLFAIEETGIPIELDPTTLESIGPCDFDGAIDGPHFTAHPFEDPETGELFTYGYDVVQPYLRYYVLNADGSLRMRRNIELMYATMMHTMAFTKTKAIVLQFPATFLAENLNTVRPVRWEPEYGARIGVFDRYSVDGPVTWYEIPACFVFHVMNAYDGPDDTIVMDLARYFRIPLLDLGGDNPSPPLQTNPDARFVRWTLDLDAPVGTPALVESEYDIVPVEFPLCDPRVLMQEHTRGWVATRPSAGDTMGLFNGFTFWNFETGESQEKFFGLTRWTSEVLFVPRSDDAPEADGWLVSVVHDTAKREPHADRVVIWDTNQLGPDDEPVCELAIPTRVPFHFHGQWVNA